MKEQFNIYANGIEYRTLNKRFVITQSDKSENAVMVQVYSVLRHQKNDNKPIAHFKTVKGRNELIFFLTDKAFNVLVDAITWYNQFKK